MLRKGNALKPYILVCVFFNMFCFHLMDLCFYLTDKQGLFSLSSVYLIHLSWLLTGDHWLYILRGHMTLQVLPHSLPPARSTLAQTRSLGHRHSGHSPSRRFPVSSTDHSSLKVTRTHKTEGFTLCEKLKPICWLSWTKQNIFKIHVHFCTKKHTHY